MNGKFPLNNDDMKLIERYNLYDGLIPNASGGFIPRYNPDVFDDKTYQFLQNKHKDITRPFFEKLSAGESYGKTSTTINDRLMRLGTGSFWDDTFKTFERGERKIDTTRALSFFSQSAKKIGPVAAAQFMIDHEMLTSGEAEQAIKDLKKAAEQRSERVRGMLPERFAATRSKITVVDQLNEVEKNARKLKFFEKQYPQNSEKFMRGIVTEGSELRKE
jgi:hypothetical protein